MSYDDCTCTGPARDAHDPECPVRKRHPRLDLGDLSAAQQEALTERLATLREKAPLLADRLEAAGSCGYPLADALAELHALLREARAAECEAQAALTDPEGRGKLSQYGWLMDRAACIRKGELP